MPRNGGCLLLETPDGWLITATSGVRPPVAEVSGVSADELIEAVDDFVQTHQLRRDRLLIAPHAESAVFATFPVTELAASRDRQTMTFRLEDSLPFDAEQVVADFVIGRRQVSSVAVNGDLLLPIVTELEVRELLVQSIVPGVILACQSLLVKQPSAAQGLVLWQTNGRCDLLRLTDGQLIQWRHLPSDTAAVRRELNLQRLETPDLTAITLIDTDSQLLDALQGDDWACRKITSDGQTAHARESAGQVLSGRQTPWFELRRDRLANGDPRRAYRAAVSWLTAAAAVFVIVLAGAWWWRAAQDQQRFTQVKQEQRDLFEQTFPDSPVPRAVVSRIESEHEKMLGSRRMTADVPRSHSALDVLHGLLTGLQAGVRSRITEVRIENGELTADVELRSHDDAGLLATALEEAGFTVDPPTTTQRDDKTIFSQLQATWTPSAANATAPEAAHSPVSTLPAEGS